MEPPRWAQAISHDRHLWRTLAGRHRHPDTDLVPAGAPLPPSRERNNQRLLEDKVAATAGPLAPLPDAVTRLLGEREPEVVEDPFWPVLARRLSAAASRGTDVEQLLVTALDQGRLPDQRPAAALWFRLAGQLRLTSADADPDIRLRPAWTDDLLRRLPERVGQQLLTSPDWPELIAVVTDTAASTGLAPAELLEHAIDSLNLDDPAAGGIPVDAAAAMLVTGSTPSPVNRPPATTCRPTRSTPRPRRPLPRPARPVAAGRSQRNRRSPRPAAAGRAGARGTRARAGRHRRGAGVHAAGAAGRTQHRRRSLVGAAVPR